MEAADAAMKRVMYILFSGLIGTAVGFIYLAEMIVTA
jgi:hypothetical protein